jgi:hypothetical protein
MGRYRKRPRAQRVNERYEARRRARHFSNLRNLGWPPKSRRLLYAGFERLDVSYITDGRRLMGQKRSSRALKCDFRGRDASYLAPPALIRTSPIRAFSHLGWVTARRDILTKFRMRSSACDTVPRYCARPVQSVRTCQCLRPRRAVWALALSRPSVLPSVTATTSAPRMRVLSRLNGWLCAPLSTLRQYPHGYWRMTRGSIRFATPSS